MKEQSFKEEVMKILEEAPSARKALQDNYDNLLNVADYCCSNYTQAGEGSTKALEETKNFTTQSLASVAYQISSLANSVLSLLDAQTNQLQHMESSINLIGQTVEMHKEKVARREIGVFTKVRRVPRNHRIIPPQPAPQPCPPYTRQPIDFQKLDGLGHGVKVPGKQADRSGSVRKQGASIRSTKPPERVNCPVAPSVSGSSFGKAVAPPTIPTSQAPPEGDIVSTLLEEAPPPPPPPPTVGVMSGLDDVTSTLPPPPPPPASSGEMMAPPPPPPPLEGLTNLSSPPPAPPLALETVVEESSLPPPSPPPPPSDSFPVPPSDSSDLPAPPPPPPPSQEADVSLLFRRSRRRSPPTSRSLSLRVRCGPAPRDRYTRSLFLPAVQSLMIPPPPSYPPPHAPAPSFPSSRFYLPARLEHLDLEVLAPPPPQLFDADAGFDDMPPLPPPVDYDTNDPPEHQEKVVALYDYEAVKPDDLSFTEGDVIYLTHRHEDGWCEGVLRGNKGFFPENYVQSCG